MLKVEWSLAEREELAELLSKRDSDVVVTFGAGNIDTTCQGIAEVLSKRSI
jgi:UDP-N-acetylmuramate-alanine ligase